MQQQNKNYIKKKSKCTKEQNSIIQQHTVYTTITAATAAAAVAALMELIIPAVGCTVGSYTVCRLQSTKLHRKKNRKQQKPIKTSKTKKENKDAKLHLHYRTHLVLLLHTHAEAWWDDS
jgi:uncharacterized protein HemX